MQPSAALAGVLVDELVRHGVRDVVLCPGSRNAPLSFALHAADAAGRLRLHVRIDERGAGFLALGLARGSGRPVPVVTTSGTAVANLHPAVVEAHHSGVPLVVLSANRPAELRGSGANQTVDQQRMFGPAARFAEVPAAESRPGQNAAWRSLLSRLLLAGPGPVHLDVAFRDPLVPDPDADPDAGAGRDADGDPAWVEPLDGRPDGAPWTAQPAPVTPRPSPGSPLQLGPRPLVVVGDAPPELARSAGVLAAALGAPVVAEPPGWVAGSGVLAAGGLLLGDDGFIDAHAPTGVLVVGRPTLGRALGRLLRRPGLRVVVVDPRQEWADPEHVAHERRIALDDLCVEGDEDDEGVDEAWAAVWTAADTAARAAVDHVLDEVWPSGAAVARAVVDALPQGSPLLLGSSSAVRDAFLAAAPRADLQVHANRGAAGIDGNVSTALGVALAQEGAPAYALVGDLTFLHDATALVAGPDEPTADLTVVVVNDDGGSIFGLLEQGAPKHAHVFERVFGTPHRVDLAALCAATRTPHRLVTTPAELRDALRPRAEATGVRVVEVRADRSRARALQERVRGAVADAVRDLAGPPAAAVGKDAP